MKAIVLEKPGKLEFKEVEKPVPGHGEVLLKIKAAAICGSDIRRIYHGAAKVIPLILGHECSGVVSEVGPGVDDSIMNDHMALAPLIPCMNCDACNRGLYSACNNYSFIGSRINGGFAEYLVAPVANLVPLPNEVDIELGAILEPSTVALHALMRGGFQPGMRVAIFGVGSIGLCAVQWARIKGASQIIVTDIVNNNLRAAEEFGAHIGFNSQTEDVVSRINSLTQGGVDVAFEMAGLQGTLEQAAHVVRPRGVVVCMGNLPADVRLSSELIEHTIRQELEIRGTWMSYSQPFPGFEWTESVKALVQGKLFLREMVSHRFTLSTLEIFDQINNHSLEHRKIILVP